MINVKKLVLDLTPEITEMRNHIHEYPELGLQETNTCAYLESWIKQNVLYDKLQHVGSTGLFLEIKGTKPGRGKTILFRGDMDALPIQENLTNDPCSKISGVMHACGHDVHCTINVGAAKIISQMKNQFSGSVCFFFQPAEEILQGAKLFLEDPDIDFKQVDDVAALHVSAELEAGTIGVRYGAILASADEFKIRIIGKGGHGAHCHTVRDPIVAASALIMGLQTLVSRETNPADSVVVSVCMIHGGVASNIIPGEVEIRGTVRTLCHEDRTHAEESIKRMAKNISEAYRCSADVDYIHGVPPFVNEDEWVERVLRVGKKMLGENNTIIMPYAAMGGDDFALLKETKPGVFIRLGARTSGGPYGSAHSPSFYCDSKAIPTGMLTIVGLVADYFEISEASH